MLPFRITLGLVILFTLLSVGAVLFDYAFQRSTAIAFISTRDGDYHIFLMDVERNLTRRLLDRPVFQCCTWSPDGRELLFPIIRGVDVVEPINLQIFRVGDGVERNLTRDSYFSLQPAWSPDGRQVAFTSERNGSPALAIVNADGSDPRRLAVQGTINSNSAWSPDGQYITFISDREGNNEIYVIKSNGTEERRLTVNQANDFSPKW